MSLFRLRGSAPATPASRPFTRLTVRLPKTVPEARVVALHAGYGETVAEGAVVMTLRVGQARRTVEAPRTGKVLQVPMIARNVTKGMVTYRDPETGVLVAAGDVCRETHSLGF